MNKPQVSNNPKKESVLISTTGKVISKGDNLAQNLKKTYGKKNPLK